VRLQWDSVPYIRSCGIDWHTWPQGSTALLTAQAGLVLGNKLSGKQDDGTLKADQTPAGLASVTISRLVAIDPGVNRFPQPYGVTEELLPSYPRQPNGFEVHWAV
jgi:hypothetical protein